MVLHTRCRLRADREVVLAAIAASTNHRVGLCGWDGGVLRFASEDLRADREVVIAALSKNGRALQFASEALRGDATVVEVCAVLGCAVLCRSASERERDECSRGYCGGSGGGGK